MKDLLTIKFDAKRVYGLDILRAVAIISVVMAHGGKILPERTWRFHDYILVDGVFLFFVLSGYLIGGILIKVLENKKATPRTLYGFWVRRWFRTVPNYFLVLTALVGIRFAFYDGFQGMPVWRYYLFVQNFSTPHPSFFSEAWTLSVEEWFYLLVPTLIFVLVGLCKLMPKRAILAAASTAILAVLAFRLYRYAIAPPQSVADWDLNFRKQVITRLDSLMFGVLGAYCAYYYKTLWLRYKRGLFWLGLVLVVVQHIAVSFLLAPHITEVWAGAYLSVFSFTLMAAGILLLLPYLSDYKTGSGPIYKALTYVSISSYSMYLLHVSLLQPLVFWIGDLGPAWLTILVRYMTYWALTIGCSILLYRYFERPTTDLRDKLVRRRADTTKLDPGI
jgi:peptidoglycan/LPS O-acetylase OafA/YrhL